MSAALDLNTIARMNDARTRQRIEAYMTKYVVQLGLFGEALNHHKLSNQIAEAFYNGDKCELGELIYTALIEYIGDVVDKDGEF